MEYLPNIDWSLVFLFLLFLSASLVVHRVMGLAYTWELRKAAFRELEREQPNRRHTREEWDQLAQPIVERLRKSLK